MKKINGLKLAVSIFLAQAAGGIGAIATTAKIPTWYATLQKPFYNPPNWLFGPVWTILFLLMGVAAYMVWEKKKKWDDKSMRWYWIQLLLNILWSYLFFGMQNPAAGLGEIILLWWAIYQTIKSFNKVSKTAAKLLWPYLGWVSFATLLNLGIWWLN
jgi:translocator protein